MTENIKETLKGMSAADRKALLEELRAEERQVTAARHTSPYAHSSCTR